jgi:hypothetical protein
MNVIPDLIGDPGLLIPAFAGMTDLQKHNDRYENIKAKSLNFEDF